MKTIVLVALAVCAYGNSAYTGPKIAENGKEVVYTTEDQVIHRLAYFSLESAPLTWFDAQLECISRGYKGLVSIKSQEAQSAVEFALVAFKVPSNHCPWIGLYRTASTQVYKWSDGSALGTFAKWYEAPTRNFGGVCVRDWDDSKEFQWFPSLSMVEQIDCFLCES